MLQKVGALVFFLLLLIVAFGLISFASEFFLGQPLVKVVHDLLFLFYRRT